VAATITGGSLMVIMVGALKSTDLSGSSAAGSDIGLVKSLGITLYKDFMLPFEVSSILFLAAM
jgi:NADH-quinone oxidoreductase subunit J